MLPPITFYLMQLFDKDNNFQCKQMLCANNSIIFLKELLLLFLPYLLTQSKHLAQDTQICEACVLFFTKLNGHIRS